MGQFSEFEFPRSTGGPFRADFVHPGSMMSLLCKHCPTFADALDSTYSMYPCTPANPWRIILGSDEATPGALLKGDNARNAHIVYWTFLEFGSEYISHEHMWMYAGLLRSKVRETIVGGFARVLRDIIATNFVCENCAFDQ